MLVRKDKQNLKEITFACVDNLVPERHFLRSVDKILDLEFVYELVKPLYSEYGKPCIDPVVLIKMQLIQYLYGIPSMRQLCRELEVNLAYKWFLGYGLYEKTPCYSVVSKNYERRFKDSDLFENIFDKILLQVAEYGFLDTKNIFVDGTHIKANANKKKVDTVFVTQEVKRYYDVLKNEIDEDREIHGKKKFQLKENNEKVRKYVSKTDSDSGMFHKGEKERCLAYCANTICTENGFILDTEVTPGNVHDSQSFSPVFNRVKDKFKVENIAMDSGYKVPGICKEVIDNNITPITPYKSPMTKEGFFKKYEFAYDEFYDCYICPNDKVLNYSTTNREGYKEYKSKSCDCQKCEYIHKCTNSQNNVKVITRHIWEEYLEKVEDIRHTDGMKEIYAKRKETIERVFADAKEKHGLRWTKFRGLAKVRNYVRLVFAAMNLKKLTLWSLKARII